MKKPEKNGSGTSITIAIAEAISDKTGREITDFSLYDSIDPEALESLFSGSQSKVGDIRVVFSVQDHTVVVERVDETVTVRVE